MYMYDCVSIVRPTLWVYIMDNRNYLIEKDINRVVFIA